MYIPFSTFEMIYPFAGKNDAQIEGLTDMDWFYDIVPFA